MLDVPMTTTQGIQYQPLCIINKGEISNIINIKGMQGLSALLHFICHMASLVDVDHLMKSDTLNFYNQLIGDRKAARRMGIT